MPKYDYKRDENGKLVFDEHERFIILEDGNEIAVNVLDTFRDMKQFSGEARDRRLALKRYDPLKGVEDIAEFVEKAKANEAMIIQQEEELTRLRDSQNADIQAQIESAVKRARAMDETKNQALESKLAAIEAENSRMKHQAKEERIWRAFQEEPSIKEKYDQGPVSLSNNFKALFDVDESGKVFGKDEDGEPLYSADGRGYLPFGECLYKFALAHPEGLSHIIRGSEHGDNPQGRPGVNHRAPVNNPWKPGNINYTEQNRLAKENPGLARSLAKEAGIDLRLD